MGTFIQLNKLFNDGSFNLKKLFASPELVPLLLKSGFLNPFKLGGNMKKVDKIQKIIEKITTTKEYPDLEVEKLRINDNEVEFIGDIIVEGKPVSVKLLADISKL